MIDQMIFKNRTILLKNSLKERLRFTFETCAHLHNETISKNEKISSSNSLGNFLFINASSSFEHFDT